VVPHQARAAHANDPPVHSSVPFFYFFYFFSFFSSVYFFSFLAHAMTMKWVQNGLRVVTTRSSGSHCVRCKL
jgi:hypothetical protein